jgi:hypothetical protein
MTAVAAGDQTFGAGVKSKAATSIADLYAAPEKFLGKTIRIDGIVTGVCEEMGCWVALAAEHHPDQTVRFKAKDGDLVFPVSAKGKKASAEGVFEKIATSDEDAHHAAHAQAGAHGQHAAASHNQSGAAHAQTGHAPHQMTPEEFGKTYHVKVTGAVVR